MLFIKNRLIYLNYLKKFSINLLVIELIIKNLNF